MKYRKLFLFFTLLNLILSEENYETEENAEYKISEDQEEIKEFKEKAIRYLKKYNYYENESIEVNKNDFLILFTDIVTDGGKEEIPKDVKDIYAKLKVEVTKDLYKNKEDTIKGNKLIDELDLVKLQEKLIKLLNEEKQQNRFNAEDL